MNNLDPHIMAHKVVQLLADRFRLSRCDILYSLEVSPTDWTSVRYGFPAEMAKRSHVKGYGLTGRTLSLSQPGEYIFSANIINDHRWSKSFGREFIRNEVEEGDAAISFLGIPLFHRGDQVHRHPYGAIIAIRPYEEHFGWVGPFATHEVALFQLVSIALGHGIDESRWHSRLKAATHWQLSIDMLWGSDKAPDEVFKQLLQIFHDSFLPGRYLIAVRDQDREQIVGRAVYGGFHSALKRDTVRSVYASPPQKAEDEDVLSRVCRLGGGPFYINTADKDDPWLVHLNITARVIYIVDGIVIVIPFPDRSGHVQAVILGELPREILDQVESPGKEKILLSPEWSSRFKEFSRHVSAIIQFMRFDNEMQRRTRIVTALHSLTSHLFSERSPLSAIRQMVDAICTEFRFS